MSNNAFLKGKTRFYYTVTGYLHWFLCTFFWWRIPKPLHGPPRKILLGNWGSLGDVVLSTGVIAEIKSTFPNCRIGLAISEESKEVCKTSPSVDWIHVLRPCMQQGQSRWRKMADFLLFLLFEQPRAAKEIAAIGYDCAIELRPFFPNLIPIFWKARIPIRVGFMTSGNGALLNAPADWKGGQYLPHCYWPLLAQIGITKKEARTLMPQVILREHPPLLAQKPYLLFHLCSSDAIKELPMEFWDALYLRCKVWGWNIYFTGKGERESRIIEQVTRDSRENLCNLLNWIQLVQHIKECSGLVSIDSVPIHLAASLKVPTIALFWRTSSPHLWKPEISSTTALGIETPLQIEDVLQVIQSWR